MKKVIMITLAVVMALGMCVGCTKQPEPAPTAGGWAVATPDEQGKLPAEVQTAFDKAAAKDSSVKLVPLAFLGSQVVAGANYAVLCADVTDADAPKLKTVKIYADLEGGAEFKSITDFDIAAYAAESEQNNAEVPSDGNWGSYTEYAAVKLPEEVQKAFDAATKDMEGATVLPIAYLGSQVVAGANYAILTANTPVVPDAVTTINVAIVYAPLSGDATISYAPLSLPAL